MMAMVSIQPHPMPMQPTGESAPGASQPTWPSMDIEYGQLQWKDCSIVLALENDVHACQWVSEATTVRSQTSHVAVGAYRCVSACGGVFWRKRVRALLAFLQDNACHCPLFPHPSTHPPTHPPTRRPLQAWPAILC
jgi:hypothetical protein